MWTVLLRFQQQISQLSSDAPVDAGLLCGKPAVLGAAIKEEFCTRSINRAFGNLYSLKSLKQIAEN